MPAYSFPERHLEQVSHFTLHETAVIRGGFFVFEYFFSKKRTDWEARAKKNLKLNLDQTIRFLNSWNY